MKTVVLLILGAFAALSSCGKPTPHGSLILGEEDRRIWGQKCYQPVKNTCTFYSECMEASHVCEKTQFPYAITYGKKYCEKFLDLDLSPKGGEWKVATMSCLQSELVLFMPGESSFDSTCQERKDYAFKSHVGCYVRPEKANKRLSFCTLEPRDLAKITLTVDLNEFFKSESLEQMRDVTIVCLRAYKGILGNYVSEGRWEQVIPKLYNSGVYSGLPQVRSVEEFPDFDIDFSGKSTEEIKESYNTLLNFKERLDKELGYSSSSGELIKDCSRVPKPDGCEYGFNLDPLMDKIGDAVEEIENGLVRFGKWTQAQWKGFCGHIGLCHDSGPGGTPMPDIRAIAFQVNSVYAKVYRRNATKDEITKQSLRMLTEGKSYAEIYDIVLREYLQDGLKVNEKSVQDFLNAAQENLRKNAGESIARMMEIQADLERIGADAMQNAVSEETLSSLQDRVIFLAANACVTPDINEPVRIVNSAYERAQMFYETLSRRALESSDKALGSEIESQAKIGQRSLPPLPNFAKAIQSGEETKRLCSSARGASLLVALTQQKARINAGQASLDSLEERIVGYLKDINGQIDAADMKSALLDMAVSLASSLQKARILNRVSQASTLASGIRSKFADVIVPSINAISGLSGREKEQYIADIEKILLSEATAWEGQLKKFGEKTLVNAHAAKVKNYLSIVAQNLSTSSSAVKNDWNTVARKHSNFLSGMNLKSPGDLNNPDTAGQYDTSLTTLETDLELFMRKNFGSTMGL